MKIIGHIKRRYSHRLLNVFRLQHSGEAVKSFRDREIRVVHFRILFLILYVVL